MRKVLIALLAIAILVLAGCTATEVEEPTGEPVGETPPPEPAPAPAPVEPQIAPSGAQTNLLTDVICVNGVISAVVTNTGDETWDVADVKIYLNAGWDKEPGCDKETLEPGESTVCDAIDWPIVQKPGKKNAIVVVADGARQTETVICPEAAEPAPAEE